MIVHRPSGSARPAFVPCASLVLALLLAAPPARAADLAERARTLVGADQGVYVEAEDGTVLVAQQAARPVHPASVSKVPTTLALLRALGPAHRFETRFAAGGPLRDGRIDGPLVVAAAGDPFFVDENALLVAQALREAGVREVAGGLVVQGPLLFDWESEAAGPRLRRALAGGAPAAAWQAVRAQGGGDGAPPALHFTGGTVPAKASPVTLVTHRSEPLIPLLKALNGYSNNIFAALAQAAGGIAAVQADVRGILPEAWREELILGDGAGAHRRNRMSPRATVAILRALEAELARHGRTLADALPVAGVDDGTLRHRLDGPGERGVVVAKTGTYGSYGACALAGALRTERRGIVYFAVLNRGVPVEPARRRQDAFVRALLTELGALPWGYQRDDTPAFARAEVFGDSPGDPAIRR
ncbi:MAG: D-alanyl-D-alanine carboxypeptidase [Deltaproteobacteria bacterium]|nr:D-alanyl-D-alanine carboxypeptidase [Deltaproteobacteria bacterium]